MVQSKEQYEKIMERIIRGKASASAVVENAEIPLGMITGDILSEYVVALKEAHIVPVRFDCTKYEDSLSMWVGIAGSIKQALPTVFQETVAYERKWSRLEKAMDKTESIKMNLISILNYVQMEAGWGVLLIMEGFEAAVEKMDEYDILKVRGLTASMRILTISHTTLAEMGEQKYKSAYFSNQFYTYTIGK